MRTLKEIEVESGKIRTNLSDILIKIQKDAADNFNSSGGCNRCRGRGWVVTWDTMDYVLGDEAEFGACPSPGCTDETRQASGISPVNTKYDLRHGTTWTAETSATKFDIARINRLKTRQQELDLEHFEAYEFNNPTRGKLVEVVKKSRSRNSAEVGLVGKIIWTGVNSYGTPKVGILDKDGNKHWTTNAAIKVLAVDAGKDYQEKHDDQYPLLCKVEKVRDNSLFVHGMNDKHGTWLPKSQILNMDQVSEQLENGKTITAMLPVWLAKKKGYLKS